MKTKLTLSVDAGAVARMKRLASRRRTSVSRLFEEWSARLPDDDLAPALGEQLRGRWKQPSGDDADARLDFLRAKHVR